MPNRRSDFGAVGMGRDQSATQATERSDEVSTGNLVSLADDASKATGVAWDALQRADALHRHEHVPG
jgi:hypothetical protein